MLLQTPIRGLRSFCVAAKCLSFKQAANQLYLTPSAVSHQIKSLEKQLGFTLFVRKTRSIELTHQGEQFYHALQPQLQNLAQTIEDFSSKPHNQSIVVAMPEFFASELFIPQLSSWTAHNSGINIQVETLKPGQSSDRPVDLSIVLTSGKPSGGKADELFPILYLPSCNQQLYDKYHHQGYTALTEVPLILHKSRPWSWHQWAQQSGIEQFDPCQIIQLDSMFAVARAAQQGMGIALAPLPMSKAWFEQGLLKKLYSHEMLTNDRYYLVQHNKATNAPHLHAFAQWIKNRFIG